MKFLIIYYNLLTIFLVFLKNIYWSFWIPSNLHWIHFFLCRILPNTSLFHISTFSTNDFEAWRRSLWFPIVPYKFIENIVQEPCHLEAKWSSSKVSINSLVCLEKDRAMIRVSMWKMDDRCFWELKTPTFITDTSIQSYWPPLCNTTSMIPLWNEALWNLT